MDYIGLRSAQLEHLLSLSTMPGVEIVVECYLMQASVLCTSCANIAQHTKSHSLLSQALGVIFLIARLTFFLA